LDPSFNGTLTGTIQALVPMTDGTVVVALSDRLVRVAHDGTVDPSYLVLLSSISGTFQSALGYPDGSVVVLTTARSGASPYFTAYRINPTGAIDYQYSTTWKGDDQAAFVQIGAALYDLLRQSKPPAGSLVEGTFSNGSTTAHVSVSAEGRMFVGQFKGRPRVYKLASADATPDRAPTLITPVSYVLPAYVHAGRSVSFTAVAVGLAPFSFQWFHDGAALPGATNATLTIDNAQATDEGGYSVAVSNPYGTASSRSNPLTVFRVPTIVVGPQSQQVVVGQKLTLSVVADGSDQLLYKWRKGASATVISTQMNLVIAAATATDAGTYTVTVSDFLGDAVSAPATITVNAASLPVITIGPVSQMVARGDDVTLSATAVGVAPLAYQWSKDGQPIPNATSNLLSLAGLNEAATGNYTLTVTNSYGAVTSDAAMVELASGPAIMVQPISQSVLINSTLRLTTGAARNGVIYQWKRNGIPIAGQTSAALIIPTLQPENMGFYTCTLTDSTGTTESHAAVVTVLGGSGARAANISARAVVSAAEPLTGGFVLGGTKRVLIRAIGPTLRGFGVDDALVNPRVAVIPLGGSEPIATNQGWGTSTNVAEIRDAAAGSGAFPLDAKSNDSALVLRLSAGGYTAQVTGANGGSGIALLEIYDLDPAGSGTPLFNISARAQVGLGAAVLVPGFVITGNSPRRVLIRAVGPTLANFGVNSPLADPQISVVPLNASYAVATNDNWGGDPAVRAASLGAGAFDIPDNSADSALVVRLPPGGYTILTSGVGGSTGTAIVEVYDLGP
jgi:hypothetical protein